MGKGLRGEERMTEGKIGNLPISHSRVAVKVRVTPTQRMGRIQRGTSVEGDNEARSQGT